MKVIKFITVLIAVVVLLSTSLFSVGASSDDTVIYGMTHDELLEFGFIYENESYLLPSDILPPDAYLPSTMLIDEPNYPEVDPRLLPWTTMPSYIQDIIYMGIEGASTTDVDLYKMPFIGIRVNASRIFVFVGVNCFLGRISNTGNIRLCTLNSSKMSDVPTVSYCYYANFDHSYNQTSDWVKASASSWGSSGNVLAYGTGTFIGTDYSVDLYLYGGNGTYPGKNVSTAYVAASDSAVVTIAIDNNSGFTGGYYITDESTYSNLYIRTFTPPSLQEVEQETQSNILASIKNLPNKIAGFFDDLKNYLLYFQAEKPEHVNPFEGILNDVQSFFDGKFNSTSDFKGSLNTVFDDVSSYISAGSSVINKLLNGVPLLNAFLIFFIVVAVIRKVVGR